MRIAVSPDSECSAVLIIDHPEHDGHSKERQQRSQAALIFFGCTKQQPDVENDDGYAGKEKGIIRLGRKYGMTQHVLHVPSYSTYDDSRYKHITKYFAQRHVFFLQGFHHIT